GFLCRGVRGALGLALQGAGHVGGVAHGFSGRFAVVGLHFLLQALQGLVHLAGVAAQGAFFGLLEGLGGFAGAVDGLLDAFAVKLGVGQFLDALGQFFQLLCQLGLLFGGLAEVRLALLVHALAVLQLGLGFLQVFHGLGHLGLGVVGLGVVELLDRFV